MEKDVPCSPFLDMKGLCIKHKNEEGGLGIYFYDNAMHGGDWIIQKTMSNDATVKKFLPKNAPLSTFRVMTGSRLGIASTGRNPTQSQPSAAAATATAQSVKSGKGDKKGSSSSPSSTTDNNSNDPVFAFSCVFRAGRAGGLTDHNSILFDGLSFDQHPLRCFYHFSFLFFSLHFWGVRVSPQLSKMICICCVLPLSYNGDVKLN
jgi:hypothetical protein